MLKRIVATFLGLSGTYEGAGLHAGSDSLCDLDKGVHLQTCVNGEEQKDCCCVSNNNKYHGGERSKQWGGRNSINSRKLTYMETRAGLRLKFSG